METEVNYQWSDVDENTPIGSVTTEINKLGKEYSTYTKDKIWGWSETGQVGVCYYSQEHSKWMGFTPIKWCGIVNRPTPPDVKLNNEHLKQREIVIRGIKT